MKKLRFLVSLTTKDNDYQVEQAHAAEEAGARVGVDIEILYADNDAIQQSQQLLNVIQTNADSHPDGIILEPVGGTAFPLVARAAAAAGIGWVVMNREVDDLNDLRKNYRVPIFSITSDHEEIGRIQGQQLAALLPEGGSVLLIQGPAESVAARLRTSGMCETKPVSIQLKLMKGNWTEAAAYKSISAWLKLSTSRQTPIQVVAAQNDAMAMGARKAFLEVEDLAVRAHFQKVVYLGVDGVVGTGQTWLERGLLTATVVVPPNTRQAIEMLAHAVQTGTIPPEKTLTTPKSLPAIAELEKTRFAFKSAAASVHR